MLLFCYKINMILQLIWTLHLFELSSLSHVQLPVHSEIRAAGGYPSFYGTRGDLGVSGDNMLNMLGFLSGQN